MATKSSKKRKTPSGKPKKQPRMRELMARIRGTFESEGLYAASASASYASKKESISAARASSKEKAVTVAI